MGAKIGAELSRLSDLSSSELTCKRGVGPVAEMWRSASLTLQIFLAAAFYAANFTLQCKSARSASSPRLDASASRRIRKKAAASDSSTMPGIHRESLVCALIFFSCRVHPRLVLDSSSGAESLEYRESGQTSVTSYSCEQNMANVENIKIKRANSSLTIVIC